MINAHEILKKGETYNKFNLGNSFKNIIKNNISSNNNNNKIKNEKKNNQNVISDKSSKNNSKNIKNDLDKNDKDYYFNYLMNKKLQIYHPLFNEEPINLSI
jgi:hypothetical protein